MEGARAPLLQDQSGIAVQGEVVHPVASQSANGGVCDVGVRGDLGGSDHVENRDVKEARAWDGNPSGLRLM